MSADNSSLYLFWKEKEGCQVIFTGTLKKLDKGAVGILEKVNEKFCVVIYPENRSYEQDVHGGWKPIKGSPMKVYSHSARLDEIMLAK